MLPPEIIEMSKNLSTAFIITKDEITIASPTIAAVTLALAACVAFGSPPATIHWMPPIKRKTKAVINPAMMMSLIKAVTKLPKEGMPDGCWIFPSGVSSPWTFLAQSKAKVNKVIKIVKPRAKSIVYPKIVILVKDSINFINANDKMTTAKPKTANVSVFLAWATAFSSPPETIQRIPL